MNDNDPILDFDSGELIPVPDPFSLELLKGRMRLWTEVYLHSCPSSTPKSICVKDACDVADMALERFDLAITTDINQSNGGNNNG